jgi:hypothetical protein
MRLVGEELVVFANEKTEPNSFEMTGRRYTLLKKTLRPISVRNVFSGRNWGWDPWIDSNKQVHHKDSERDGNPYLLEQEIVVGKGWRDLAAVRERWLADHQPYPSLSGSNRATGYLGFIDVDPASLLVAQSTVGGSTDPQPRG